MRATKLLIAGAVVASTLMLVTYAHGQRGFAQKRKFGREKLVHAQKVLEGISTEDFRLIEQHASRLQTMAPHLERKDEEEVVRPNANFSRYLDQLMASAREEDVHGATLAYVGVTLSCMECHRNSHPKEMALSDHLRY